MFASPVAYPVSLVPEQWRLLYSLNPMAGVIEGFQVGPLRDPPPGLRRHCGERLRRAGVAVPAAVYFKQMERMFADVV